MPAPRYYKVLALLLKLYSFLNESLFFQLIGFITWLGYVNSTLNPIIYTIFNMDFREAFKRIISGKAFSRR